MVSHFDSTTAIQLATHDVPISDKFANIVRKIKDLLGAPWKVILEHTYREDNACPDWLAKYGTHHGIPSTLWKQAPPDLGLQLLANALGVEVLRLQSSCICLFSAIPKKKKNNNSQLKS